MREIKFRVYDKDLAKYLEGCEIDSLMAELSAEGDSRAVIIKQICPARYIFEQYTGLKDRNGKKIYENDIIKDTSDGDCLINAVFWCEKGGFWGVKPRSPFAERDWGWFIGRDNIEVIGNVHENKELLGGEE